MSETDVREGSVTGCVRFAALFQHRLLDEPPTGSAPATVRRRYQHLTERAGAVCGTCPLRPTCLYDAVVVHDVSGYVAGTTQRQRLEIRRRVGVTMHPEDLDTIAGATGPNRPVDHEQVLRLRRADPDATLETIAHRLGCSLSTVKRHLRRARDARASDTRTRGDIGAPTHRPRPTVGEVMAAAAVLLSGPVRSLRRAA